MEGLGDLVKAAADVTGITKVVTAVSGGKDCGCEKRRQKLNKVLPFKK